MRHLITLKLDLARDAQESTLEHRLRLTECRTEVLVLGQHHVAVEGVEHVERPVDLEPADGEDFPEAQIELRPAVQKLAAREAPGSR